MISLQEPEIHKEIFQLVYNAQGFTHSEVYNMPVYLRRFYLQELLDVKKLEKEHMEKASKKSNIPNKPTTIPKFKR